MSSEPHTKAQLGRLKALALRYERARLPQASEQAGEHS